LKRFCAFLEMARQVDHLVLLGDIFDFWFDYPHFRLKGYEELLIQLDAVRDAGVQIHFAGGNHDVWAADYLHQRYGVERDAKAALLTFGARRVQLLHGDGIWGKDWLYGSFRWLVKKRPAAFLAKALHPELLYALAMALSGASRKAGRDDFDVIIRKAQEWFQRQVAPPWDLLIMGHVHHAFLLKHGGRVMAVVGGWLDQEGYGLLREGQFELRDFANDPHPHLPPRVSQAG
jgi:UDP-2,3-diacylglucosamine hydrolase